jgi:predicted deacylase
MEILGARVRAGRTTYLEIEVASLYTRTKIDVPVIVEKSAKPGPTLLLTGGIHGDEVNGIEIIRRLIMTKALRPEKGAVIAVPIVNVMAFLNMNRKFADGRDLNRSFPGNKNGSLASKLAYSVSSRIIPHADFVVDLHTGADDRFNFPQIRYDKSHPENLKLAKAFDAPFTILQDKPPKGTMRELLRKRELPGIVFEGGKSSSISEEVVNAGMHGVLNVMKYLGLTSSRNRKRRTENTRFVENTRWIRAKNSGMFQLLVENGKMVRKGELLGYINGPFAQFQQKVTSPVPGYIFCVNETPVVYKGDALFHIGQPMEKVP